MRYIIKEWEERTAMDRFAIAIHGGAGVIKE